MSKDLNVVALIGRLTRDPEIRYTSSGTAVVKFSLANGERIKQGNEWIDYTNYFDAVVFGNQAENCDKYLRKGSKVNITGSLKHTRWQDKETQQTRSKVEIMCQTIGFLDTKPADGSGSSSDYPKKTTNNTGNTKQAKQDDNLIPDPWGSSSNDMPEYPDFGSDDDIPF